MPARPRGWARRRGKRWLACWYDETGSERTRGGFGTKGDALDEAQAQAEQADAIRHGDLVAQQRRKLPTLGELVEEFLAQHNAEPNTLRTLKARLRYALDGAHLDGEGAWREIPIDRLDPRAIGAWRKRLPARSAWAIHKALRQVLHYAMRVKLLDENVACSVPNPEPKRQEVQTFEGLFELELIAAELVPRFAAIPIVAGLTGLRPEEWIALERRDVDRAAGVLHVRRVFTDGTVKPYGKQHGSLRAVPLPGRAADAIAAVPARIDTQLLFPGHRGDHLDLHNWRSKHWKPALDSAGIDYRPPYALRHTYAAFSIAAGVSTFELSRFMGTSLEQIDKTYGHLLPDSLDRARGALDLFVASAVEPHEAFAD